jgi:hypothetical protein
VCVEILYFLVTAFLNDVNDDSRKRKGQSKKRKKCSIKKGLGIPDLALCVYKKTISNFPIDCIVVSAEDRRSGPRLLRAERKGSITGKQFEGVAARGSCVDQ